MLKIALVDDETMVRKALVNFIDWEQLDCDLVFDGSDGLEMIDYLNIHPVDLILTDIKMPRVNGIELAKYIFDHKISTKIIILTAYADFSFAQSAIQYNVLDFLLKTGDTDNIIEGIEKAKKIIIQEQQSSYSFSHKTFKENQLALLKSIIDQSEFDYNLIESKSSALNITLHEYYVISFSLEDKFISEQPDSILHKTYSKIIDFLEIAFKNYDFYIITMSKNLLCCIIYSKNIKNLQLEKLYDCCHETSVLFHSFIKFSIGIGISSLNHNITALPKAYSESIIALKHRFFNKENPIILYSSGMEHSLTYSLYNNENINDVLVSIKKGNKEKIFEYVSKLFETQKSHNFSPDYVRNTGILILNMCIKVLHDNGIHSCYLFDRQEMLHDKLLQVEFFSQYTEFIFQLLEDTCFLLNAALDSSQSIIISNALKYIENNFLSNITLGDVAEATHVNSSYLSRLFKLETGHTLIFTINEMKITKAKELLLQTSMKIYEVANFVGIEDTTYFSHLFKKHCELTPKQYKQLFSSFNSSSS